MRHKRPRGSRGVQVREEGVKLKKVIRRGRMIPGWYGIAWLDYTENSVICYPIPLNVVVAVIRNIWTWLEFGYRGVSPNVRDAYRQGYEECERKMGKMGKMEKGGGEG